MAADMLNTLPHEHKKREGIHAAYTGFGEFTALMAKFREAFDSLYNEQNASTTDEATERFED